MAVSLLGVDEPGHPLDGRVPASGAAVVLFTGVGCALDREVRRIAEHAGGPVVVVDVDAEPLAAQHFKVRVLPTWHVWVEGKVRSVRTGAVDADAVASMLGR